MQCNGMGYDWINVDGKPSSRWKLTTTEFRVNVWPLNYFKTPTAVAAVCPKVLTVVFLFL